MIRQVKTTKDGIHFDQHTVIGDVNAFVDRAYDNGALGVSVLPESK